MQTPDNMTRRQFIGTTVAAAAYLGRPLLSRGTEVSKLQQKPAVQLKAIAFPEVTVTGAFWKARLEINRTVTLPHCFKQLERVGLIDNFARAAGLMPANTFQEHLHDGPGRECDLYKVIEGASYVLQQHPDKALDQYLDAVIAKIAAAQEPDGYLYPARRFLPPEKMGRGGPRRWENRGSSQELYDNGHLYEAAVAHYQATGKRSLLDVAIKNADLICHVFGPKPDQLGAPFGHPEIELALVRLWLATGDGKYLKQAQFFIDGVGRADPPAKSRDVPLVEQQQASGHCVMQAYAHIGMADLFMHADRQDYLIPLERFWDDVVSDKLYVIGGPGVSTHQEGYGYAYELPNDKAYCETCAAISHAMWAHRMFLIHGDAAYLDVVERIVYNNFLSGVSLAGDRFFYVNRMESTDSAKARQGPQRFSWHGCPCCPTNLVRFMPVLAGYAYAQRGAAIYIGLFGGSEARISIDGAQVRLIQEGEYPWEGNIKIRVAVDHPMHLAIHIRIPGWARNQPLPSDLYRFAQGDPAEAKLVLNGQALNRPMAKGFAIIQREWESGDTIQLELPMPVRRLLSHDKVIANRGKVAIQRGPVVFCVEAVDHAGKALNLVLPNDARLEAQRADILGGITIVKGQATAGGKLQDLTAIPYYAWANRTPGEMSVWLPTSD